MKKVSKFTKRTGYTLSLNADRGDATWQQERGERWGNARKAKANAKIDKRRVERRKRKINEFELID